MRRTSPRRKVGTSGLPLPVTLDNTREPRDANDGIDIEQFDEGMRTGYSNCFRNGQSTVHTSVSNTAIEYTIKAEKRTAYPG